MADFSDIPQFPSPPLSAVPNQHFLKIQHTWLWVFSLGLGAWLFFKAGFFVLGGSDI